MFAAARIDPTSHERRRVAAAVFLALFGIIGFWSVTIPLFWLVTLYNLKSGHFGAHKGWRRVGEVGYSWVPSITLASYIVVAVLAQLRLDVLAYL